MKKTLITAVIASLLWITASTALADKNDATLIVQRDMLSLIRDGRGRIVTDTIDIGTPEELFDGDRATLVRSKSVNPFTATLVLDTPMSFDRVRLHLIPDETHEWTMEIADTEEDLQEQRASYKKIIERRRTEAMTDEVVLDEAMEAGVFRLTIRRLTGDDYVHIHEWEFPVEQKLKDLEVLVLNYAPRDTNYKNAEWAFVNTVLTLRAWGVTESGATLEITDDVEWSVNRGKIWMDRPNRYLMKDPGTVTVTAQYGDTTKSADVEIIEYRDFKGDEPIADFANDHSDIDVLFIERLPRIDYDAPNGGWPEEASTVTWRAHVYNWGTVRRSKVPCRFTFDDKVVDEGVIEDFEPGTFRTVDWEWTWEKKRHRIAFEVDPENEIEEFSEANNRVEDFTDALTIGFYVEEYEWRVLHEYQPKYGTGTNSWADYAQRQIWFWNEMHANAIHPSTREGVLDRVRIDRIHVVPNNSLPMAGGLASNNPNNDDKSVDLIWGFEARDCYSEDKWRKVEASSRCHTWMNRVLMHELNHARYIIDLYGFDVDPKQVHVLLDDGTKLSESKDFFPSWLMHFNKYRGLMGGGIPWTYDEYVALSWNRVAGTRARGGNYNSPSVIGEYLQEHPERNTFTFVDGAGNPLSNAEVWIYRTVGTGKNFYGKNFDNVIDLTFTLDEEGTVDLPWTIFAEDGIIRHTYGVANGVVLVRVNHGERIGFTFIEVSALNVEYMRGHTAHGHYTITVENLQ